MKKKFRINIWDYVDIDAINEALDEALKLNDGIACDIKYKLVKCEQNGDITLLADFDKEKW